MSTNNPKDSTVSQMSDLFGEPPLIRGEDKARYWRLHAAVEHEIKPQTIFDKIHVREVTDKLWQQQRCKQSAASLVDSAYVEALASLLRPFIVPLMVSIDKEDTATVMARDYYSGDAKPKRVEEVETRLAVNGISPEQIRAKAMQICGSGISMFNRMETNCEASLRMLRREKTRRDVVEDTNAPGSDELIDEAAE
jgi:hypothetical protein